MDLFFCVAEQPYCIEFLDEAIDFKSLLPSSGAFFRREIDAPLMFRLTVGEGLVDHRHHGMTEIGTFDNGDIQHHVWKKSDGGYRIHITDLDKHVTCALDSNRTFSRCSATLHGTVAQQAFGLENAIMIAFAMAGAYHKLILVHASVPMIDGRAYLFQGKSGTGKSTHSSLWQQHIDGASLLNDDNPAVRIAEDGQVYTYGTPWSGKTPCYRNLRVATGGCLRLQQAPHNRIRRLPPLEAFASLLSSCSVMVWDKENYNAICDTVAEIVKVVPSFHLECLPDAEAARLSHSTMTSVSS